MKIKEVNIGNLKGLKQAEKLQNRGYIGIHNGFFNPFVTMIKGTEEETTNYRNKYFK